MIYYVQYALKGLSVYALLYMAQYSAGHEVLVGRGEYFLYVYSLMVMASPVFLLGFPSYIYRFGTSQSLYALVIYYIIILSLLLTLAGFLFKESPEVLAMRWVISRVIFTIYESINLKHRRFDRIYIQSAFYLAGILVLVCVCMWRSLDYFILGNLIVAIEILSVLLSLIVKNAIKSALLSFFVSFKPITQELHAIFPYNVYIIFCGAALGGWLSIDKVFLNYIDFAFYREYAFITFLFLGVHRFVTTPFVMKYSSFYNESDCYVIPRKVILKYYLALSLFLSTVWLAIYAGEAASLIEISISGAFIGTSVVILLALANLTMMYFKREIKTRLMSILLLLSSSVSVIIAALGAVLDIGTLIVTSIPVGICIFILLSGCYEDSNPYFEKKIVLVFSIISAALGVVLWR